MTRRIAARMYVFSAALFLGLAPMVQGAVITQRATDNYVAFEAEDYTSMGGTRWRVIDLVNPYTHPDPDPAGVATTPILLPPDTNASGGAALLTDFSESSPSGTGIVVYQLELTTTGTYYYYTRDGAFENGDALGTYGNEDSHYIPLDFNVDPDTGEAACRYDGYGATEGQYAWRNGGSSRTFSITTPGTYEFRIKNRESGFSLDRIILSTTAGLNAWALDALYNHDIVVTYATADGDWSTAAQWDHGAPTADMGTFIGNGRTMTLNSTAAARGLSIGYDNGHLPGNGALSQTGGDLTVAGALTIGVNIAGTADVTGSYTASGGSTLTVGSPANRSNIVLGYNSAGNTTDAVGTLDLSNASQFTAYLNELTMGRVTSSDSNGTGEGTLKLAPTSTIDAREIMVSWSNMHGQRQPTSTVELGADTTIKADTFTVAGYRGMALVEFGVGGGVLDLSGSSDAEADLLIANCDSGTNNPVDGHMDMSGGTFNAALDRLLIGYDLSGAGNGGSVGKLTFAAGAVQANSLMLGDADSDGLGNGTLDMSGGSLTVNGEASLGTGTAVSIGAINLSGGAFAAESVTKGIGTANFNWTGGTLHVETFGFDLVQNNTDGLSVLAPGRSLDMTTIQGNYSLLGGQIEIELNSPLDQGDQNPDDEIGYDFVHVEGDALLNGQLNILLADGYEPEMRDSFDVLQVDGEWSGTLLDDPYGNLTGDPLGAYAWWDVQLLDMPGGGHVFRLTVIPEPNSLVLALLGLLVSGCLTCRRPYGVHR